VKLTVYNILGQVINVLIDREMGAGFQSVNWDGKSSSGIPVATGIYFYRLVADDFAETKKMILLK